MSFPVIETVKCSVCNHTSKQTILLSSNTFGPPDLDLRPSSMLRETMCWWIQECPHCGYVSESIDNDDDDSEDFNFFKDFEDFKDHNSNDVKITEEWLASKEFKASYRERKFKHQLAERFYKHYLICKATKRNTDAFYAILHAAWSCDDARDFENAIFCRSVALEIIETLKLDEDLTLVKADLLRRTGNFSRLIDEFKDQHFSKDILNQIIAFQLKKAALQDISCYTIGDVTKENA